MKLHYESVSSSLLSSLQKMMSSEVFSDFRLVGGTALSLQRGHRRFKRIDDIEESPEGIDSMKSMDFWELKVMDLKQMIKDYIRINKL